MNKAKAAVSRKGAAAKPVLGSARASLASLEEGLAFLGLRQEKLSQRAEFKRGAGMIKRKPQKSAKQGRKSSISPIELYYWPTPNGHKISIFLEEARFAYLLKPVNIN